MFNPNQAFLLVQKLKLAPPRAFPLGVKAELEKNLFNLPKINFKKTELYGLVLAPRMEKGYYPIKGGQFATLGANVPAFISNLGKNNKQKMLKVGPKFCRPSLLV
jgi:hypothetical protein